MKNKTIIIQIIIYCTFHARVKIEEKRSATCIDISANCIDISANCIDIPANCINISANCIDISANCIGLYLLTSRRVRAHNGGVSAINDRVHGQPFFSRFV